MGREIPPGVNLPPLFGGGGKRGGGKGSGGKQKGGIGALVIVVSAIAVTLFGVPIAYLTWAAFA